MYYFDSVEEFNALLGSVFTSDELLRAGIGNYTPENLNAILGRSEGFIDSLRYKGAFVEDYQAHAFPRKLNTGYVVEKNDERVQKAVCCVFYDYVCSLNQSSREELIRQGVKSISTAGVSESYGDIKEIEQNKISLNYAKFLGFCLFKGVL